MNSSKSAVHATLPSLEVDAMAPARRRKGAPIQVWGWAMVAAAFTADLMLPLGFAGGMLYVVPAVLGLWASSERYPKAIAAATVALTVVGYLLSDGENSLVVVLNRAGALVAIAATTVAVIWSRRNQARIWDVEETLRGMHALASDADLDFSAKADALLRMGCRRFRLPTGLLTRVEHDTLEFIEVVAPAGTLQVGDVVPLANLPCERAVSATVPIHLDHSRAEGKKVARYHPDLAVDVYIGCPVRVGERIFGTLAFCGPRRRAARVNPTDFEIIRLMASWLGALMQRREAEMALDASRIQFEQAQKMEAVGRLAAGIAHDFNNLLMGMRGCAAIATRRVGQGHAAVPVLDELGKAVDRGAAITRQLLTFSRARGGESAEIGVDEVVGECQDMLRRLLGEDVQLEVHLGAGELSVAFEPGQLDQIIMNLAVNARDAMGPGDELTIETSVERLERDSPNRPSGLAPGTFARIVVRDTGHGMDELTRTKIFEPFFTTKEIGRGTGLGLSTVYAIVRGAGGHIAVESEPNKGTAFTILLPRSQGVEPVARAPEVPRRGNETILVVEDEDLVRLAIENDLEPWGYQLLLAADGEEAARLCADHDGPIHVLLTDMVLPMTTGTQVAEQVRSVRPGVNVVFMSAYPREQLEREGRIDRDALSLQKPFTATALMTRLREVLGPGLEEPVAGLAAAPDQEPVAASLPAAAPGSTGEAQDQTSQAATILFVEDDDLTRAMSRELLELFGYRVLVAASGAEARAHFDECPDLIITDLNLPDVKGPVLIEELRRQGAAVPAILSSGDSAEAPAVRKALAAGNTQFAGKPVDPNALQKMIEGLLGSRSSTPEGSARG